MIKMNKIKNQNRIKKLIILMRIKIIIKIN